MSGMLNHVLNFYRHVWFTNAAACCLILPIGLRVGYPCSRELFLRKELRTNYKKTNDIVSFSVFRSFVNLTSVYKVGPSGNASDLVYAGSKLSECRRRCILS
jgi:hypothetical protein